MHRERRKKLRNFSVLGIKNIGPRPLGGAPGAYFVLSTREEGRLSTGIHHVRACSCHQVSRVKLEHRGTRV